jgi:hypothetical protein
MLIWTQKLAAALPIIMFTLFPLIFLFVFNSTELKEMSTEDAPPFFPYFPFVFFFVFAGIFAWPLLSLPHTISVTYDKQLVFRSLLRSQSVKISELISIEPRSLRIKAGVSGYLLKHLNGKVLFPGQFTGQYLLLYELKQANPSLVLTGC